MYRVDTPAAVIDTVANIHNTVFIGIDEIFFFTTVLVAVSARLCRIIPIAGIADNGCRPVTERIVLQPDFTIGWGVSPETSVPVRAQCTGSCRVAIDVTEDTIFVLIKEGLS